MGLGGERVDYEGLHLARPDVGLDPIEQFRVWLAAAREAGIYEPEAMTLSTADAEGRPSARYVLLRGLDERGFAFYTNYRSAKARDLAANLHAALTFGWLQIHRSVRIEGTVERLPEAESDAYFAGRPRAARISAWASPQSEVISSREELERAVAAVEQRFAGTEIPRPPHWGGFLVRPERIELWQGRSGRLHDRLRYERAGHGWRIERLAP
ncbi:MAG TPA: pyridoxamine 5'-phosphate oxidase [Solirubrobacteraceae bacterium]